LAAGDTVGELSVIDSLYINPATITAIQPTTLLCMARSDYETVMHDASQQDADLADVARFFARCPCFEGFSHEDLNRLAQIVIFETLPMGTVLWRQNKLVDTGKNFIPVVRRGELQVLKEIVMNPATIDSGDASTPASGAPAASSVVPIVKEIELAVLGQRSVYLEKELFEEAIENQGGGGMGSSATDSKNKAGSSAPSSPSLSAAAVSVAATSSALVGLGMYGEDIFEKSIGGMGKTTGMDTGTGTGTHNRPLNRQTS
jgi:hypothetical protein